jgi:hypothetical protein
MAGGLLQIVAFGAENVYMNGNPQITFFKIVYRRHTNFSQEVFENDILDGPDFNKRSEVKIYRLGDLMTKMYLKVVIGDVVPNEGATFGWVHRLGHAILKSVSIVMGGVCIDRQYGEWLDIWYELARAGDHERGYDQMIGDVPIMTAVNDKTKPEYTLYIPFKFWFNRHVGLALPLVSIQYHEIFIRIEFHKKDNLFVHNCNFTNLDDLRILRASLLIDYIYLDREERDRFASVGHEYLIEQVQFHNEDRVDSLPTRLRLLFNYPTKELIWAVRNGLYLTNKKFLCYTHEEDWTEELARCATQLLLDSSIFLEGPILKRDEYGNIVTDEYGNPIIEEPGEQPPDEGCYEEFVQSFTSISDNGNLTVENRNDEFSLWINTCSLQVGEYKITAQIMADIVVTENLDIIITNVSGLTAREVSYPIEIMEDTRLRAECDVCVNEFGNYGLLIDGSVNPVEFSRLDYNNYERFEKRNYRFFNYLQPEMHHNNTPADGINVYSFSIQPEKHQPMGTSNFSKLERVIMTLWIRDHDAFGLQPELEIRNPDTILYIYAFSYNILRVMYGLTGLSYSD